MTSIQMNIGDHVSPVAAWIEIPTRRRGQVNWARRRAKTIARDMPSANRYFRGLSGGRTLSDLLRDNSIWINFDPTATEFGAQSIPFPNEISIGPRAFAIGRWTVLATLIHELAHVNGAPGGGDTSAEEALLYTGLGKMSELRSGRDDPNTPYDPTISG